MKRPVPVSYPTKPKPGFVGAPVESASAFIDEKIKELGDWRGKMLAKVRAIIHEADPEIVEERKWVKPTSPGTPVGLPFVLALPNPVYVMLTSVYVPYTSRRASQISPTVA